MEEAVDIRRKCEAALRYVLYTCVVGASNKIADIKNTAGWVVHSDIRYHVEGEYRHRADKQHIFSSDDVIANAELDSDMTGLYYKSKYQWYYHASNIDVHEGLRIDLYSKNSKLRPLSKDNLAACNLDESHLNALANALLVMEKRKANCGQRSALLVKYLWENSKDIRNIKLVSSNTFDHAWVVVNDEWIIDSWYENGIVYPVADFQQQINIIKEFAKTQVEELNKINILATAVDSQSTDLDYETVCEVKPDFHKYPSSEPLESYYFLGNSYSPLQALNPNRENANVISYLLNLSDAHKQRFQSCLTELNHGAWKISPQDSQFLAKKPFDKDNMGNALNNACLKGDKEIVLRLLQAGAPVNYPRPLDKATPLYLASRRGSDSIVKLLLEYGALVNQPTTNNETSLFIACKGGFLDVVNVLLGHGADMEVRRAAPDNHTPLILAITENQDQIAKALVAHGADTTEIFKKALPTALKYELEELAKIAKIKIIKEKKLQPIKVNLARLQQEQQQLKNDGYIEIADALAGIDKKISGYIIQYLQGTIDETTFKLQSKKLLADNQGKLTHFPGWKLSKAREIVMNLLIAIFSLGIGYGIAAAIKQDLLVFRRAPDEKSVAAIKTTNELDRALGGRIIARVC